MLFRAAMQDLFWSMTDGRSGGGEGATRTASNASMRDPIMGFAHHILIETPLETTRETRVSSAPAILIEIPPRPTAILRSGQRAI